jgi:hypothetical protein
MRRKSEVGTARSCWIKGGCPEVNLVDGDEDRWETRFCVDEGQEQLVVVKMPCEPRCINQECL